MSRGLVFASGPREGAGALLTAVVEQFPQVTEWTVVHRDLDGRDWRDAAAEHGGGREFRYRSDKPAGSKQAFLRELSREDFAARVVWFSGDTRFDPAKIAAFMVLRRRGWAWDGHGFWRVGWLFAARRLAATKEWRRSASERIRGALCALYRSTVGWLLARPILWVRSRFGG